MSNEDKNYRSTVEKIIPGGKHGPYVVSRNEELGSVTFSLDSKVWQEKDWPEPGMWVVLSHLRKKPAGWRAQLGRYFIPSDVKQTGKSQKQGE
jgi:hypothetical protein